MNIVVSGPSEIFPQGADRFLFLHGLNAMPSEDGFEIWISTPSIGAPPLYLAALLQRKYGASLKPDTSRMLKAAIGERLPADGLERFLGAPRGRPAGDAALRVISGTRDFIANCSSDHWERRALLEGAGWLPVGSSSDELVKTSGSRPCRTRAPSLP